MNSINTIQRDIFNFIKETICGAVNYTLVAQNAIKVETSFLDWKGTPVSIYVTENGEITDGGSTINQLRALRVFDDFEDWPFKEDFFYRSKISPEGIDLMPQEPKNKDSLLAYIQGIARLPYFFEPKPIETVADKFPSVVRESAIEAIIELYPKEDVNTSKRWAASFAEPRTFELYTGLKVYSDMSPKRENLMVQIISHENSSPSIKRQHVSSKILSPVLLKRENSKVQAYAVIHDLKEYPIDSRNLLHQEAEGIIELRQENSKYQLAELLVKG